MYEAGQGVFRDPARALELYDAAGAADDRAAIRLCRLFAAGPQDRRDTVRAGRFCAKAAAAGDTASATLLGLGMGPPRIGEPAPDFEAETTQGILRLEDFRGSWLVLFSHPADFTPVCASELIAFAGIRERLRALHCELLGLSVDSVFSHIAWVRSLAERFSVVIDFPLVADTAGEMARRYGMEQVDSIISDALSGTDAASA